MIDSTTRRDAVAAYVRFTLNYVRDLNAKGGEDQWERLAVGPVQIEGDRVVGFLGLQSTTHAERQAMMTFTYDGVNKSWNPKPTAVKQIRVAPKLQVPDTLKKAVSSSNVDAVSYFPGKKVLQIKFKSGKSYQYFDVPRETYDDMITAPSKGQFFWDHIRRKGYSYRRVEQIKKSFNSLDLLKFAEKHTNQDTAAKSAARSGGKVISSPQGLFYVLDSESAAALVKADRRFRIEESRTARTVREFRAAHQHRSESIRPGDIVVNYAGDTYTALHVGPYDRLHQWDSSGMGTSELGSRDIPNATFVHVKDNGTDVVYVEGPDGVQKVGEDNPIEEE